MGVIVPRYGASVVARNRVRRRLREKGRRHILPTLRAVDLVIRALPGAYRARPEELTGDLEAWLQSISE
jgi:ribonuclease P protein component